MKLLKRILIALAVLLLIGQFVRPPRNSASAQQGKSLFEAFDAPPDIREIMRGSCADCHSDSTRYPWYAEVQPVGWWLNNHIEEGKRELNISQFGGYRLRRQYRKLGSIAEQVNKGEMPLNSYLLIHHDADLSASQRERLSGWAGAMRDSMKARYPVDSLEQQRR